MRWFVLFATSLRLFAHPFDEVTPSTPEELVSLNTGLLVDGYISAASGQFCLTETDLHMKGAQDLVLQRTYIPPQILGRYDDKDELDRLSLGLSLSELIGKGWVSVPQLRASYNGNFTCFRVRDPQGAVVEFQIIGNRGHLKTPGYGCSNLKGEEPTSSVDIRNIELWVDGSKIKVIWPNGIQRIYRSYGAGNYYVECELLPNGKALRYSYNNQNRLQISATDKSGKYIYATVDEIEDSHYRGIDGREAKLVYERREIEGGYKKLKRTVITHVLTKASNPKYSTTAAYNERTLLTSYDALSYPISCTYFQQKNLPCRIQRFSTPSGSTTFAYDLPIPGKKGGSTTVTHPNGSETIYRFNANFLLSSIENRFGGKLYNQKLYSYDSKQHISKIESKDGQGNFLLTKTYECDQAGNPLTEKWEGDIGQFSIQRAFSKNRLIREEYSDGLGYEYTYLEDTHLLTSKITLSNGAPIRQTEYVYDDACNLIEEKEVGQRVTTYLLHQEGPHLHMPLWKIEKDWDENLLHKTRFVYDRFGNLSEEEHYGADGNFAYRTTKLYDSHDNLLEETNPLGQIASYTYDARGRQIREVPFSQDKTIQRTFDDKGRLTILKEGNHTTRFAYNSSDELVQKTNYLGLQTNYLYHPVHSKPISIEEDPTLLEIDYDNFGREVSRRDAYGATTTIRPNSYGAPLLIMRPDGGLETFSYASNGTLLSAIDPDGLTTAYTYDPLKRILSKTVGTRTTTYAYDAYNLLEEKDPLGISTHYRYNLFGQKIQETRADRSIQFSYDSLGFLSKTQNGPRYTSYQNDPLGRVISKSLDGQINTSYAYDPAGNIASITNQETTYFSYDPYNRLIEKTGPDGAKTTISYKEGPKLVTKTITDPNGSRQIETYNAHGLLLKKEIPNCILEEYSYDSALRLVSQDHLTFTYTLEGLRSSLTEAGQRTTLWTYTPGGKIKTKTKPDGTELLYSYTPEGELAQVNSREFQYDALGRLIKGTGFARTYDPFDNVIQEDFSTSLTVITSYDLSNRPTQRTLPDQSSILYEYTGPFLTKISRLNAQGDLLYAHTYDQFDPRGRLLSETGLFQSTYRYDQAGRLIFQQCPFFTEELTYDDNGNLIQKGANSFAYDTANQLVSSSGQFILTYDKHYNRISRNGGWLKNNELNEISDLSYNENGCLIQGGFQFDEFDQLIQAKGEEISYDALGRRLQKGTTSYLYLGDEEVGAFEKGKAKELKIPGLVVPIALEINNKPYYPVADIQGIIRMLVDSSTSKVCLKNTCDPFGTELNSEIPYAYAGKRYDAETGLVYFGKRYYIPTLGRWLTPDPIGPIDHSNLYQYVFNNPYRFQDFNGEFAFAIPLLVWGAELAVPALSVYVTTAIYGAAAGAIVYGGYKLVESINSIEYPVSGDYYSGNLTPRLTDWSYRSWKNRSVNPSLPANPDEFLNQPDLEETTHPNAGKKGHRTFENKYTGEQYRHDQGRPGATGHEANDHWHHLRPDGKGGYEYLDGQGSPVPKGHDKAHIYTSE